MLNESRGIVAGRTERMAPSDTAQALPASSNRPILAHRVDEVLAARGVKATLPTQKRAQHDLINAYTTNEETADGAAAHSNQP